MSARYLIISYITVNLMLLKEIIYFENLILSLVLFQTNNSPPKSNFCNLEFITESRKAVCNSKRTFPRRWGDWNPRVADMWKAEEDLGNRLKWTEGKTKETGAGLQPDVKEQLKTVSNTNEGKHLEVQSINHNLKKTQKPKQTLFPATGLWP